MTASSATTSYRCLAAAGSCDVTPEVGMYHRMWGAASHDISTGIHRPLQAHVVVQQDVEASSPCVVWISLDHCLLMHHDMVWFREDIAQGAGVDVDQVFVCFTHTHGAGLMDSTRTDQPGGDLVKPYLKEMANTIAATVADTVSKLQPCWGQTTAGKCTLGHNRDQRDEQNGIYVCGHYEDGTTDDTLLVGRWTNDDGHVIATMVNYACHPTTLAWDNTLISPDYIGATREVIQNLHDCPCLFLQGASGDIGPREGYVGDTSVADRNGRQLGYSALAALESLDPPGKSYQYAGPVVSGATIGYWEHGDMQIMPHDTESSIEYFTVDLDYQDGLESVESVQAELEKWEQSDADDARARAERCRRSLVRLGSVPTGVFPFEVTIQRLGRTVWVLLGGELYNWFQRELRERYPDLSIVVTTIANGSRSWYILKEESYGLGLYQEEASMLAAGSLERLLEAVSDRLRS